MSTSNRNSIASDNAAARSGVAARVMSVREFRRLRRIDQAVEQGAGQARLAAARVAKARTLAAVVFLSGAA